MTGLERTFLLHWTAWDSFDSMGVQFTFNWHRDLTDYAIQLLRPYIQEGDEFTRMSINMETSKLVFYSSPTDRELEFNIALRVTNKI